MGIRDFHNRLRVMRSIDRHELVEARALAADDIAGWDAFNADPFDWFIRAGDETADRVWDVIEHRAVRRPAEKLAGDAARQAAEDLAMIARGEELDLPWRRIRILMDHGLVEISRNVIQGGAHRGSGTSLGWTAEGGRFSAHYS